MSKQKIRTLRLQKQEISLEKQPLQNAFVKRVQDLKFYFCLYNLQDDFKDGFYFGLLDLHPQYPFAAPKLFVYTPNGRYQSNLAICTSFTNYHQESWTSAWNVRTLIQATISFMYANEPSYGCRQDSSLIRKKYARESLEWNMNNQLFAKLFGQKVKLKVQSNKEKMNVNQNQNLIEKQFNDVNPLVQKINLEPIKRNRVQNDNQLNERLIDPQQVDINNDQRNEEDRKWYKKKIIIFGGIVGILAGVAYGIRLCFSLAK